MSRRNSRAVQGHDRFSVAELSLGASPTRFWQRSVARLTLAAYLAQTLLAVMPAYGAGIVVAPNAPAGSHPLTDTARNGVPIVDIAAPGVGGVSNNIYSQFNVGTNGLILNNSGSNVSTQLSGWISGNPLLGVTPASIILNQVTGGNPSQLLGAMEVAGQRAGIIVANPDGITCDGCGFLNTNRVTLTTGTPQFGTSGNLQGFNVQGGELDVGSQGLNAAGVEQLDLLARNLVVDGGSVWAQNLNVVTGANQIDYGTLQAVRQTAQGSTPLFAVDVKNMGGMYANQIVLIATEQGLGVNSSGRLQASQGNLTLSANGDLTLNNTYAGQALNLNAAGNTTLNGSTSSGGAMLIASAGAMTNAGQIDAGAGLALQAASLANSGAVNQHGNNPASINVQGALTNSGSFYSAGQLQIDAATLNDNAGQLTSAASLSLQAQSLTLTGTSIQSSGNMSLTATQGSLTAAGVSANSGGNLTASATGVLSARNGNWQANGNISLNGASIDNTSGNMAATGELQVNTAGQVINDNGRMASNLVTTVTASGGISNRSGTLSGGSGLVIDSGNAGLDDTGGALLSGGSATVTAGQISNSGGTIAASGPLDISSSQLDNSQGNIASTTGTLQLNTGGQSLINDNGFIQAAGIATITSGALSNQNGVIGANAILLSAGSVDNTAGSIVATTTLSATTLAVNNQSGLIQGGSSVNLNTQGQTLTNTQSGATGGIVSGGALTVQSGALDNTGGYLASNGNQNLTIQGDITNTGGVITTLGNLAASASGTLDNQSGAVTANGDVSLAAQQLMNDTATGFTQAGFISGHNVTLSATTVTNTGGLLQAGNDLTLGTSTLDNSNGTLSANHDLTLTAAQFVNGGGTVVANNNLTVSMNGTTLAGSLSAGVDLNLNVTGGYVNAGQVTAQNNLNLAAGSVTNNAGALLSAGNTLALNATAGDIDNVGTLVGGNATLNANGAFNNTGNGLLNSNGLTSVSAASISNAARIYGNGIVINTGTLTNTGPGAIAARNSLQIAANSVSNTAGAQILSLGDLAMAGSFDQNGNALTPMSTLLNASSTIEGQGNVNLTVTSLTNRNDGLVLGTQSVTVPISGQFATGSGITTLSSQTTVTPIVLQTAPAQIIAGGNLGISGSSVDNINSTITAGGTLSISAGALNNTAATGTQTVTQYGQTAYPIIDQCAWYQTCGSYIAGYSYQPYTTSSASTVVLNTVTVAANTNSLPNPGSPSAASTASILVAGLPQTSSAIHTGRLNLATPNTVPALTAGMVVSTNLPALVPPANALFTIQPSPTANYLVETDPAFTNEQNFLSSNYFLQQLNINPAYELKRYGDGFYEQQLVEQQIVGLTGQEFIGGYDSTQSEYLALMNAGVAYAKQFDLTPGIALSAAQMAKMTSDMVWLTTRTVTLANGTTQQVLVPQVYLVHPKDTDLTNGGSLISGGNVTVATTQDLTNGGTIKAAGTVTLAAGNDLTNDNGELRGNQLLLSAGNDLSNLSGMIAGSGVNSQVNLLAGRDINVQTQTLSSSTAMSSRTNLGNLASVQGDSVNLQAGRDVNVQGANIAATQDMQTVAGRNIDVGAVTTQFNLNSSLLTGDNNNYLRQSSTTQNGSSLAAGGNVLLQAGGHANLTASNVNAGQDIQIAAQNVTVQAGVNSSSNEYRTGGKDYLDHTIDTAQNLTGGSLSAGNNLVIQATGIPNQTGTGDITLNAAQLTAQNGVADLQAAHDITLGTVNTAQSSYSHTYLKSSGLFSSSSTTDIQSSNSVTANGSSVAGNSVQMSAGHDISVTGGQMAAQTGATLEAGNDISLLSAQNTASSMQVHDHSSSGLGLSGYSRRSLESGSTQNTVSQTGSNITTQNGDIVLVAGLDPAATGNGLVNINASGIDAVNGAVRIGGGNILIGASANQVNQTSTVKSSKSTLSFGTGLPSGSQMQDVANSARTMLQGSMIAGANGVTLDAAGLVGVDASHLLAGQGDLNISGSDVILQSDLNTYSSSNHASHSDTGISLGDLTGIFTPGQGLDYKSSATAANTGNTLAATTLGGKNITVTANTGDVTLAGVTVATPGVLALNAAQNLNLSGVVTTSEHSLQTHHSDVAWQGMGNSGAVDQTLQMNQINAAAVKLNAARITVDMGVKESAAALAQEPGMTWLQPLLHDPSLASKVNWNQIELAHQKWNYSEQGLTPAAAVVVTLVVAYVTAGAGSASATALAGGSAAGGAAITAGEAALASRASVDLIDNGGNLAATLKQLGSSESVRSIVTAMLTAGALSELSGISGINPQSSMASRLGLGIADGVGRAVINSAINGTSLESNLRTYIAASLLNVTDAGTNQVIGENAQPGGILESEFPHLLSHAIAGCAIGSAMSGTSAGRGCGAGALGGTTGELAAQYYGSTSAFAQETPEQQIQAVTYFASMVSGIAAAATGQGAAGIAIASASGASAARYNWLGDEQQAKYNQQIAACGTSITCKLNTYAYWKGVSVNQDGDTLAGIVQGLGQSGWNSVKGIGQMLANPSETIQGLQALVDDPAVRNQVGAQTLDQIKGELQQAQTDLQVGGTQNAVQLGQLLGDALFQVGTLAMGPLSKGSIIASISSDAAKGLQIADEAGAAVQAGVGANSEIGKIVGDFSAIEPGPLEDNLAGTFAGGRYTMVTLQDDTILYRAGTDGRPFGQYFSLEPPTSIIQTRIDKAILPEWRDGATSPIDTYFAVKIPAGTQVYIGEVGTQNGFYVGGTQQVVVPKPWTIPGIQVINSYKLK